MADRGVDVGWLDRVAAPQMHRLERLAEPQQVLKVPPVAGTPSTVTVRYIGGARHRAEGEVVPAEDQVARRIAGVKRDGWRRQPDLRADEPAFKANALRPCGDRGALPPQDLARLCVEDVEADLLEHGQRSLVDRLKLIL